MELAGVGDLLRHIKTVLLRITHPAILALSAVGFYALWRTKRWAATALALTILLPFGCALLTRAGPTRVYLPALLGILPLAAAGMVCIADALQARLRQRWLPYAILPLAAAGCFIHGVLTVNTWRLTDWKAVYPQISASVPEKCYLCLAATSSYPVKFYFSPEVFLETLKRTPWSEEWRFALVGCNGTISGIHAKKGGTPKVAIPNSILPVRRTVGGIPVEIYRLMRITESVAGETQPTDTIYIASILPQERSDADRHLKQFMQRINLDSWLFLNPWLHRSVKISDGEKAISFVAAAASPDLSETEMLAIEHEAKGGIRFFRLASSNAIR